MAALFQAVGTCQGRRQSLHGGTTLWESLQYRYNRGVNTVDRHHLLWHYVMRHHVDYFRSFIYSRGVMP